MLFHVRRHRYYRRNVGNGQGEWQMNASIISVTADLEYDQLPTDTLDRLENKIREIDHAIECLNIYRDAVYRHIDLITSIPGSEFVIEVYVRNDTIDWQYPSPVTVVTYTIRVTHTGPDGFRVIRMFRVNGNRGLAGEYLDALRKEFPGAKVVGEL